MTNYSRREVLCKIGKITAGLVATLVSPEIIIASPNLYPYKTPTSRDDLFSIPENHLLARKIYGEARGENLVEKIAIGYTPFNRKEMNRSYYGKGSLSAVLLHIYNGRHQYDCFNDSSKDKDIIKNFQETLDPAKYDPKAWQECLGIANWIIKNPNIRELNQGQTSYVEKSVVENWIKEGKTDNWFFRSIPVSLSPYDSNFKHIIVREPTVKELKKILKAA